MKHPFVSRSRMLASVLLFAISDKVVQSDYVMENYKCDLQCHNNGICRHLTTEKEALQKKMQSGQMIQQCVCPLGYRGMSCDVPTDKYPCSSEDTGRFRSSCDCVLADQISVFAGEQCRKPFTQYCASLSHLVGSHISFCTNGGKCKGDILAAEATPGNTSNNYVFQHAGCICPPEFTGEHCEFLNKNFFKADSQHQQTTTKGNGREGGPDSVIAFSVVSAFGVAILAVIVIRRRRSRAHPLHSSLPQPPEGITFHKRIYDDVFSEPNDEPSAFCSDEEFHDTLPALS